MTTGGYGPASPASPIDEARRRRADRARQVADVLRRQVLTGAFPDAMLPGESALAGEFGASRNAIREALDVLRGEGLVERVPGVGTVVSGRKYPHPLERLLGLAETLHEHREVTNAVRAAGLVTPPPASGPSPASSAKPATRRDRRTSDGSRDNHRAGTKQARP